LLVVLSVGSLLDFNRAEVA